MYPAQRITCVSIVVILLLLVITGFDSCSKSSEPNTRFLGTYHGVNCRDSIAPDVVITAGVSGDLISIAFVIDTGVCATGIGLIGMVSGNTINFATHSFNDLCGNAGFKQ